MFRNLSSFISFACAACFSLNAAASELKVEIHGLKNKSGTVQVAIFNQEKGFPMESLSSARIAASEEVPTTVFSNLEPGEYAVFAYQDENANGKLDHNFLKMPLEPLGFSRDARGRMGPPGFSDAKFSLGSESKSVTINLH